MQVQVRVHVHLRIRRSVHIHHARVCVQERGGGVVCESKAASVKLQPWSYMCMYCIIAANNTIHGPCLRAFQGMCTQDDQLHVDMCARRHVCTCLLRAHMTAKHFHICLRVHVHVFAHRTIKLQRTAAKLLGVVHVYLLYLHTGRLSCSAPPRRHWASYMCIYCICTQDD